MPSLIGDFIFIKLGVESIEQSLLAANAGRLLTRVEILDQRSRSQNHLKLLPA
jgi:hypothetical protein